MAMRRSRACPCRRVARYNPRGVRRGTRMEPSGLQDLIRLAQSGRAEAMERLLESVRPYLTRVAESCLDASRASRSASDLVQEAEFLAWRRLRQFRGGRDEEDTRAKFHAWLGQIVRRLGADL